MPAKGKGRSPKDDDAAMEAVRKIKKANKNLSFHGAALRYAEKHREAEATPASAARRIAGKLLREAGIPKRRSAARRNEIRHELAKILVKAVRLIDELIALESDQPRR